jgi:hypothetical protein
MKLCIQSKNFFSFTRRRYINTGNRKKNTAMLSGVDRRPLDVTGHHSGEWRYVPVRDSGAGRFAAIQPEFNTALSGQQWVVNANLLALGALILIGGALGDQLGRRRIFMTDLAVFTGAALLSGFAPTISIPLGLQAVQGAGAALMVPQSLAIINDCFPKSERGRAIGLWAGISTGTIHNTEKQEEERHEKNDIYNGTGRSPGDEFRRLRRRLDDDDQGANHC